ncbi:MAG: hypothetical protein GF411_04670 [Candidatus Lokiarchaeota archaeon]|nr:hypothetical protein [Candidatus Lokiarchaeota archaeon]
MSKFELIKETMLRNLGEQVPLSLWKHHPELDRTPQGLAEEEIKFHRTYDHDLLKISFHGRYPVVDWGCKAIYDGAISGSTTCETCIISDYGDWETLEPLDVNSGEFGNQIQAVKLIHEYAQDKVPTMATVFDAPMVVDKLCDRKSVEYFEQHPDIMESVLELITKVMIEFGKATLDAGANGIFLASQHSTFSAVSDEIYNEFVYPYDLKLISALRGSADFIVMHLHAKEENEKIRYDRIARTPGLNAINWEDQSADLSLRDGKKKARKAVLGGIDHNGVFREGTPDEASDQITEALQKAGLKGTIVAPGCVITIDTPPENIQAVTDAVRSINPWSKEWEE